MDVSKNIEKSIALVDGENPTTEVDEEAYQPMYKKYENAAIPVSKSVGTVWRSRRDQVLAKLKDDNIETLWDECIAYYKNDQSGNTDRDTADEDGTSQRHANKRASTGTENIVFANVSSLVPSIYAKNPEVTILSTQRNDEMAENKSLVFQRLVTTLLQKRSAPGVNLKPKIRRAVTASTLTNQSYIEVGYTQREVSSNEAMTELAKLSTEFENAKSPQDVREIEGKLKALEERVDILSPSGPWTKYRGPKSVLIDPDTEMPDLSDANWVMVKDFISTDYIRAVYMTQDDEGRDVSIFKPTHVLKTVSKGTDISGHDDEITNFSLLTSDNKGYKDYGYASEEAYNKAQRTCVYYVWDKSSRRVYLFNNDDWSWPIWVWDDPYGLEEFFPIYPLAFNVDPEEFYARSEVAYYLDQQDEINKINWQINKMRSRVSNSIIANKRIMDENAIRNFMKDESDEQILIVDMDPTMDMTKAIMSWPVPAKEFSALFDKTPYLQAIDRLSSVTQVIRGNEYKTNTTNKAIESYESSTQTRLDEKIDAIEELIGRIGNAILTMCIQFMPQEEVVQLIGPIEQGTWENMPAADAAKAFELTITGGSSLKPTSKVRKEQAAQLVQMLGQFASKVPAAFVVALKVLERAFGDEFDIKKEDWAYIEETIQQEMQRGSSAQGQQGAAQGQAPEGGQPDQNNPQAVIQQMDVILEKLPDQAKQMIGQAIAQGVPLVQIVQEIMQRAGAAQQQPQAQNPNGE